VGMSWSSIPVAPVDVVGVVGAKGVKDRQLVRRRSVQEVHVLGRLLHDGLIALRQPVAVVRQRDLHPVPQRRRLPLQEVEYVGKGVLADIHSHVGQRVPDIGGDMNNERRGLGRAVISPFCHEPKIKNFSFMLSPSSSSFFHPPSHYIPTVEFVSILILFVELPWECES